ncbi:serine/threonine protein phosphatase [Streptomyces sp. NPDC005355]|uniref:PP2C family protein-serine/threonine phosphatase n=1 Tax=Streptomyces sp. NPDC005355 TaxID=3157038 RepID=UPI0033BA8ED7
MTDDVAVERHGGPPRETPPREIWEHGEPGLSSIVVRTEKRPGRGEDAEPLALFHRPGQRGLLAVFDGSGGSGSSVARTDRLGRKQTGAWVGSRVARLGVESWFADVVLRGGSDAPERLHAQLRQVQDVARPQQRSKIVGSMRRELPTTLAGIQYEVRGDGVTLRALWAGDSRAYELDPGTGLAALTRDHTEETDALAQLRQDPPMTNVVCADRDFVIDTQLRSARLPCVLLCATDGFFGYVRTPADFEYVLLSTLMKSHTEGEWADRLARRVEAYTGDDASLALVALGFPDFMTLRSAFSERYDAVRHLCTATTPETDDPAGYHRWQDETWLAYRPYYEKHMPPLREERV